MDPRRPTGDGRVRDRTEPSRSRRRVGRVAGSARLCLDTARDRRVELFIEPWNAASIRVAEKCRVQLRRTGARARRGRRRADKDMLALRRRPVNEYGSFPYCGSDGNVTRLAAMNPVPAASVVDRDQPNVIGSRSRRIGWGVVTVLSVVIGAYAVAIVASNFALVAGEVASQPLPDSTGPAGAHRGFRPGPADRALPVPAGLAQPGAARSSVDGPDLCAGLPDRRPGRRVDRPVLQQRPRRRLRLLRAGRSPGCSAPCAPTWRSGRTTTSPINSG